MRLLHGIKKMKVRPYICPEKGCGMSWAKIGLLKNHIKRCHAANDGNFENYNDSLQELDMDLVVFYARQLYGIEVPLR